jgi:dTDP-4-amino-4,6-dideoxygalactose transaminase
VASGTDALHLALRALGIGPGDEVITTPFTFVATTEAIGIVGATPVFADIDAKTYNLDPEAVEDAVTSRTRAILPVHLYGQPCDMDALTEIARRRDLAIVEDCAQSIGATYRGRQTGSFGAAGCLSFFPSKNLGGMGDGGMVVANDDEVADRVEMLRRHGGRVKYYHEALGLNSRLDELQAAILRVKLPHLSQWEANRRRNAYRYNAMLKDVEGVVCPHELTERGPIVPVAEGDAGEDRLVETVYHQYTIEVDHRDDVVAMLQQQGIGCAIYYPVPLHVQEVHASLGYKQGSMPVAERAAQRCLSLPMFPELTEGEIEQVVSAVRHAVTKIAEAA